jgi:hypothetical protein
LWKKSRVYSIFIGWQSITPYFSHFILAILMAAVVFLGNGLIFYRFDAWITILYISILHFLVGLGNNNLGLLPNSSSASSSSSSSS